MLSRSIDVGNAFMMSEGIASRFDDNNTFNSEAASSASALLDGWFIGYENLSFAATH